MMEKVFTDEIVENSLLSDEEEYEQLQDWGDWTNVDGEDGDDQEMEITCLFCDLKFISSTPLYEHCSSNHSFHFNEIRKAFSLDTYGSFKLINYIRSQAHVNKCWCCVSCFPSKKDMQNHLHGITDYKKCKTPWEDDKYLTPFMRDDPLLYTFDEEDEEIEDGDIASVNNCELINSIKICDESDNNIEKVIVHFVNDSSDNVKALSNDYSINDKYSEKHTEIRNIYGKEYFNWNDINKNCETLSSSDAATKQIKHTNKSYFGSYSSFGIHREMIKDEVRMGAYRQALLNNPSLMKGAVVMDVGCGTGILSLFAAQAGASKVFAIEASAKMAAVANQVSVDNDVAWDEATKKGVIKVVEGMVEEVGGDEGGLAELNSVDVIVSEWMGYCLMYETMLSSVLFARDRWLKPGGAILPDTATMFSAGFGKGGTSIPFWEDVYGFNMSCIGREDAETSARLPLVDFLDPSHIVTTTAVVQRFDLVRMRKEDMDFTANVELEPKCRVSGGSLPGWTCYGVVLWFETGFTDRFCKEKQAILSTSPQGPKTHWAQTLLTFSNPVSAPNSAKLHLRISIARDPAQYRCIDISLETTLVEEDGLRRRCCPPQMFNLC